MKRVLSLFLAIMLITSSLSCLFSVSAESIADDSLTVVTDPYDLASYNGIVNYKNNISEIPEASITDEGIDGSYCLVIDGNGVWKGTYLRFDENVGTKFLTSGKTYVMKLSVKTDNGITSMKYGVRMHSSFYSTELKDTDITTDWTEFSYTFTPETTATDYWVHMYLEYTIPVDSKLYIDNIAVYDTEDSTQTNLFKKGNFDADSHYKAENIGTNYLTGFYNPNELADYAPSWGGSGTDNLVNLSTVSIERNIATGDSYALKFSTGTYATFSRFAYHSTSASDYYRAGETYRFGFRAKKSGTVENFSFKLKTTSGWKTYTLITATINDDWTYYAVDINFDAYALTNEGHKHWGITCTVGENSYLLVDDIEIYNITDTTKTNNYKLGSFETADTTYKYEPYDTSLYRLLGTNSDGSTYWNYWDKSGTIKDSDLVTVTKGGYDFSYGLKITGDGLGREIALNIGKGVLAASTAYTISFKARVDTTKALKAFSVGFMTRGAWTSAQKAMNLYNASGISSVTTEWKEFTYNLSTTDSFTDAYQLIYIKYQLPADAVLYLDDISISAADGTEHFSQGMFERKIKSWNKLEGEVVNDSFRPKYVTDYTGNGFTAEVIAIDNAINGNNVLAIGFDDHDISGRVYFEVGHIRPRATYKLEMYVMFVGDVKSSTIYVNDCDPNGTDSETDIPESTTVFKYAEDYGTRDWVKIETVFTDKTTATDDYRWSGMNISFSGAADSGMLVDAVSITPIDENIENPPNIFEDAGFEYDDLPEVTWSDTYFGENIEDLSFMNDLPKTFGELGNGLKTEYSQYADIMNKDSDFSYLNMHIVATQCLDVALWETKEALKNGKEIWFGATYLVSYVQENGVGTVYDDWQERLDLFAYNIQAIAGDRFQGIYFDEPHLKFTNNDQFVMVTKYIRENYKKRVFSMAKHDMFNISDTSTANVTITAESHKYVTDLGYWNYSSSGMDTRANNFNEAAARLSPDVRKWICCLMGQTDTVTTEEENISMFKYMLDAAKTNNNFGGILLWDAYDTDGYGLLNTGDDGTATYNSYRELLKASSADLADPYSWLNDKHFINEDNIIAVDSAYLKAGDFINSFDTSLQDYISVKVYGIFDAQSSTIVTDSNVKLTVSSISGTDSREFQFTLANDVNGDGSVNILDVVRAKRISAGAISATALNYAAAGGSTAKGISAANIAAIRDIFFQ